MLLVMWLIIGCGYLCRCFLSCVSVWLLCLLFVECMMSLVFGNWLIGSVLLLIWLNIGLIVMLKLLLSVVWNVGCMCLVVLVILCCGCVSRCSVVSWLCRNLGD